MFRMGSPITFRHEHLDALSEKLLSWITEQLLGLGVDQHDVPVSIHDHDCVIGYYEHGKADGALYLLMEYVEGSNLKLMYAAHDPVLLGNVGNIIIDIYLFYHLSK